MINTSRSCTGVSSSFFRAALTWIAKVSFSPSAPITPSRISRRSRIESSSRVQTSANRLSIIRSENAIAPFGGTVTSPA